MGNKIKAINTYVVDVPLVNEWKISLYASSTRGHAIVEVVTEDGVKGYGEAAPSPAFMGETAATIKLVNDLYLAPALIGQEIHHLSTIHERMDGVIYGQSSAKSAIDIALHDAWGKTEGKPVYDLVGGLYRKEIPLTYVIGMKSDEEAYKEAERVIDLGFEMMKIKVGSDPVRDIRVVESIRQAITDSGKDVRIRLDGNQGYSVSDAIKVMKELERTGDIESIEQPVEKWDLFGMKKIRESINTPVMADEMVFSLNDMTNIVKMECADIVNLKTCKVGGIHQSKKIAGIAEAAGMTCTIGSNLELGVGIAASMHVAASTPVIVNPSDFICGAYLHEHDLIETPMWDIVNNGKIEVSDAPGLGIELAVPLEK